MNIIRLYWYKKNVRGGNFGDELGPYIIRKLSSWTVEYVPIARSGFYLLATYVKNLLAGRNSLRIFPAVLRTFLLRGSYITSVGSIIGWASGRHVVWGSGILHYDENVCDAKFLAVRGMYTWRKLVSLGYRAPDVLGDPALLLPLVYSPSVEKRYRVGIVPHHTQTEALVGLAVAPEVTVIDLLDGVESVTKKILACECIISTSLHGLIVAHAFRIPALWYEYPGIKWRGSDVKFFDYFSAVGIEEYVPFRLECDSLNVDDVLWRFNQFSKQAQIQSNLALLQKKLLDVAPFPVDRWSGSLSDECDRISGKKVH